jgi:hypothetical protein
MCVCRTVRGGATIVLVTICMCVCRTVRGGATGPNKKGGPERVAWMEPLGPHHGHGSFFFLVKQQLVRQHVRS